YPDLVPAWLLKRRRPRVLCIAGYYLFAPPPWARDTPYKGRHALRGLVYWLMQRPSYWLVRRYADVVFVTSEPDVQRFVTRRRGRERVIVVQGGVDVTASEAWLASDEALPVPQRRYDACFVGRLHYQKGVLLLPDIWRHVCARRPGARLALIGNGHLETDLQRKITAMGLHDNIALLGFRDGPEKYEIFKQSKVMVHPATYDSGGMAAAEGMAWRLPGVSFDLEALKTYYPRGMVKVPPGDTQAFADAVLRLLDDEAWYARVADEAHALIVEVWDWRQRAERVFRATFAAAAEEGMR
ncbi:MAG: glycosyltransferase family 4 protein, partial [Actinobacteria bacterium]|nr:glycosyltransferase family 4 protein [Actinomycetota bacterium]